MIMLVIYSIIYLIEHNIICFLLQIKISVSCYVFVEIAQVTTAYTAAGAEQLNLSPGQLILILNKNPSGWWLGELQVNKTNWFILCGRPHICQVDKY